jgi:hypothetical protein
LLPVYRALTAAVPKVEGKSAATGANEDFVRTLVFTEVHPS